MCCTCWEDDGAPQIDNEKVRNVLPLIDEVYVHSGAGGNLHIVLDDSNVEDENLAHCRKWIEEGGYKPGWGHDDSPEQLAAEMACLIALEAMTEDERNSALGLRGGCWRLNDKM